MNAVVQGAFAHKLPAREPTLAELIAAATAAREAFNTVRDGPVNEEWKRLSVATGCADFAVCARLIAREGLDHDGRDLVTPLEERVAHRFGIVVDRGDRAGGLEAGRRGPSGGAGVRLQCGQDGDVLVELVVRAVEAALELQDAPATGVRPGDAHGEADGLGSGRREVQPLQGRDALAELESVLRLERVGGADGARRAQLLLGGVEGGPVSVTVREARVVVHEVEIHVAVDVRDAGAGRVACIERVRLERERVPGDAAGDDRPRLLEQRP